MGHSTQALWWPFFLCTQSAILTEGSVAKACTPAKPSPSSLPGDVSALWAWDVKNNEDCLRFLQMDPNVFLHLLAPLKACSLSFIPPLPIVQPYLLQQLNYQYKGLMTRAPVITSQTSLSSDSYGFCFHPDGVSDGLNSNCGSSGPISSTRLICIQASGGISLSLLFVGCRGHHRKRGRGVWRIYILHRAW